MDADLFMVSPISSAYESVSPNQRVRVYPVIGSNGGIEKTIEILEPVAKEPGKVDIVSKNLTYIENNIQIVAWLYQSFYLIGKMDRSVRRSKYNEVLKNASAYSIPDDLVSFLTDFSDINLPVEGEREAGSTAFHALSGLNILGAGLGDALVDDRVSFLKLRIIGIKMGHPLRINGTDDPHFLPQLESELYVLESQLRFKS